MTEPLDLARVFPAPVSFAACLGLVRFRPSRAFPVRHVSAFLWCCVSLVRVSGVAPCLVSFYILRGHLALATVLDLVIQRALVRARVPTRSTMSEVSIDVS